MNELKIHDIKALSAIPDLSFYIFVLLMFIGLLILSSLIFFLYKYIKNRKNSAKQSLDVLKNIDFSDAKKAAYLITKHGRVVANNEREQKLYEELEEELAHYKYKKEVHPIDENTKHKFQLFMDAL